MLLDATTHYALPLTADQLFDWHAALFPTGRSGIQKIAVGKWRDDSSGPMQVVSDPIEIPEEVCASKLASQQRARRKID